MDVYVNGKRVRISPKHAIGKGGEADVYDIGHGVALKVFKTPDHPDYDGLSQEQDGARRRSRIHQRKLRQFPSGLPERVVVPQALATDASGKTVLGYTMPLVGGAVPLRRLSERSFRVASAIGADRVLETYRDLHRTVDGIHQAGMIIGDFNDLNVLVRGAEAHCIDADSYQFGSFPCEMFTVRFVDPTRCDPHAAKLMLVRPHDAGSDWYAYAVMLFSALCYVDPYGGVYLPKDPTKRVAHDARPLKRMTVFHPEVRYPKPAVPYGVLPDDLLQYFHATFERDERGVFPLQLLATMRWTHCTTCGTEHARTVCPTCTTAAPAAVKSVTVVRGTVTATRIFRTNGVILHASVENGVLKWLFHENGEYRREDRDVVLHGDLEPSVRYRIRGDRTIIGKGGQLITIAPGHAPESQVVDTFGLLPAVATNAWHTYWVEDGRLLRDGPFGIERIGDVLQSQTLHWVGETFGFGWYRAGGLSVGFVFDAERRGVNDAVALPKLNGQLVDATTVFGKDRCWFFVAMEDRGKTVHHAIVLRSDGTIEATARAEAGEDSWLGSGIRGNAIAGRALLVPTDNGVVRVEATNGALAVTKTFPDTEPFVHAGHALHACRNGLAVVSQREIVMLKIS